MRESIFYASLRSFFLALCGVIGVSLGALLIFVILGLLVSSSEEEPEISYSYSPEIRPNASGVRKALSRDAPVILKLNIHGAIGTELLSRQTVEQQLIESRERALKDGRVKAILLHIDSPGGTVTDADGIYNAIKAYKELHKVPVYAYVSGFCASGGMYIACAADKIFASDVSLIGSVGVISPSFFNVSQLIDKIGVKSLTIYEGKGKDELNPLRPWKPDEGDNIKSLISYYYSFFVDIVTKNRPQIDKEKLINEYGAKIFPANLAKEYGYIDEVGYSYNETLKQLAHKISIEDDYYQVIVLESKSWLASLFKEKFSLLKGEMKHQIDLGPETNPRLMNQFLYLYRP
jgi:protease IV